MPKWKPTPPEGVEAAKARIVAVLGQRGPLATSELLKRAGTHDNTFLRELAREGRVVIESAKALGWRSCPNARMVRLPEQPRPPDPKRGWGGGVLRSAPKVGGYHDHETLHRSPVPCEQKPLDLHEAQEPVGTSTYTRNQEASPPPPAPPRRTGQGAGGGRPMRLGELDADAPMFRVVYVEHRTFGSRAMPLCDALEAARELPDVAVYACLKDGHDFRALKVAEAVVVVTEELALGLQLRARRRRLGLRVEQLAATSGVSAGTISNAESGTHTPQARNLRALLAALDALEAERPRGRTAA